MTKEQEYQTKELTLNVIKDSVDKYGIKAFRWATISLDPYDSYDSSGYRTKLPFLYLDEQDINGGITTPSIARKLEIFSKYLNEPTYTRRNVMGNPGPVVDNMSFNTRDDSFEDEYALKEFTQYILGISNDYRGMRIKPRDSYLGLLIYNNLTDESEYYESNSKDVTHSIAEYFNEYVNKNKSNKKVSEALDIIDGLSESEKNDLIAQMMKSRK